VRKLGSGSLTETVGMASLGDLSLHASIRENLSFAKPEATYEEIKQPARAASWRRLSGCRGVSWCRRGG